MFLGGPGGVLGSVTVGNNQTLSVSNTATVVPSGQLGINGGAAFVGLFVHTMLYAAFLEDWLRSGDQVEIA